MRSIRARVTAGALIVAAAVLCAAGAASVLILRHTLTEGVEVTVSDDLESIGDQLDDGIRVDLAVGSVDDDILVKLNGATPAMNDEDAAGLPALGDHDEMRIEAEGEAYLAGSTSTDRGVLTVARSLDHVDESVRAATLGVALAVPLVVLLVVSVVWVVTGRALQPVERLRRQVELIGADDLNRRVEAGDDELGALAATMNGLLGRIEQSQTVQRRFVSDASHELRSPLATIRQHAEVAVAHPESMTATELADVVLDEGERMQVLVEDLLLLARLDERRADTNDAVDLDDIAFDEAARLRAAGVAVDVSGVRAARVTGSRALIARAVRNLAINAARHASSLVAFRVFVDRYGVRLQIEDDGEGVAAEDRERVFDRFARLDEGRARDEGGGGLGLAIVREVARAHGGSAQLDAGILGGARFTLTLPQAPRS